MRRDEEYFVGHVFLLEVGVTGKLVADSLTIFTLMLAEITHFLTLPATSVFNVPLLMLLYELMKCYSLNNV